MFSIVDQTVNEALRKGTRPAAIEAMILMLQCYPVEAIELSLQHWPQSLRAVLERNALLLRCKVCPSRTAIAEAGERGFKRITISWLHQTGTETMAELESALAAARVFAREVCLSVENASNFSADDLKRYRALIARYDVDRLLYHDQNGVLEPFRTYQDLHALQQAIPCALEFHGHNHLGLATANSLAALRAGITYVGASVGGVGVPGHAAMEELFMAVTQLWKQGKTRTWHSLASDCARILSRMGVEVPSDKAVIGAGVFNHESGIHVDGIGKNPSLYEAYQPEAVGLARNTIIGKHSGTTALKQKFLQWNVTLSQTEAARLLEQVREIAIAQKGAVSDQQLRALYTGNRAQQPGTGCVDIEHTKGVLR